METSPFEDEQNDILLCKNGDLAARDRLVLSHQYIVTYYARVRCRNIPLNYDDLVSEFNICLLENAWKISPDSNKRFAYYAKRCVKNCANDILRYFHRRMRNVKITERLNSFNDSQFLASPPRKGTYELEIVQDIIDKLPDDLKKLFLEKYDILNREIITDLELCEKLGITFRTLKYKEGSVSNYIKKYITKHFGEFSYSLKPFSYGKQAR